MAVVVVAGIVAGLLVGTGGRPAGRQGTGTGRTQHTVLLSVRGADGNAVESVLLAHDSHPPGSGVELLVPSAVIAEVPGAGSLPFGRALGLPGGGALAGNTLADLAGVTVDGSWVLDEPTFATLIDRVGGVTVTVDTAVTRPAPGGRSQVVVEPGHQHLGGAAAVAYATFVGSGEPPTADLPRLQAVLDGLAAALPPSESSVAGLVQSLGKGSTLTGLGSDGLATLLVGFAGDVAHSAVAYDTVPVLPIDTGGGPPSYRIDATKLRQLVTSDLAGSVPAGAFAGNNRVLVENGVGTPGLGASVRDRLVHAGLTFVGSRNAPHFGYPHSVVLIFEATQQAQAVGNQVAHVLGLPAGSVQLSSRGQSIADVIVIIGSDYRP